MKYNAPDCLQEEDVKSPVNMVNPWVKQHSPINTGESKEESDSSWDFTNGKLEVFTPQLPVIQKQLPVAPLQQPDVSVPMKRELEGQMWSPQKETTSIFGIGLNMQRSSLEYFKFSGVTF